MSQKPLFFYYRSNFDEDRSSFKFFQRITFLNTESVLILTKTQPNWSESFEMLKKVNGYDMMSCVGVFDWHCLKEGRH